MIKTLLFDFSYVFLFPKDKDYSGTLNGLYKQLNEQGIEFNFWDYYELNIDLLNFLEAINLPKSIFTSGIIQNDSAIKKLLNNKFKHIISAELLQLPKSDPDSYLKISTILNFQPSEVLFIDDDINNITAAKSIGMETQKFINNLQIIGALQSLI